MTATPAKYWQSPYPKTERNHGGAEPSEALEVRTTPKKRNHGGA